MDIEKMNHNQFRRFEKASYDPSYKTEVADGSKVGNLESKKQDPDDKKSEFRKEEIRRQNEEEKSARKDDFQQAKGLLQNQMIWPPVINNSNSP